MDQVDVNNLIKTTVTIAKNEYKYVSDLQMELDPELPTIKADSQLIGQTLLNLIVNAAHAIAEKKSTNSS